MEIIYGSLNLYQDYQAKYNNYSNCIIFHVLVLVLYKFIILLNCIRIDVALADHIEFKSSALSLSSKLLFSWLKLLNLSFLHVQVVGRFLSRRFHPKSTSCRWLFPFYFSNITLRTDLLYQHSELLAQFLK